VGLCLASDIAWFVQSLTGEPRRHSEHTIALHKAASEVRYIVIFNNGSTTEPNGVSELSLAPHRATVLTTKHPPPIYLLLKEGSESPKCLGPRPGGWRYG
jgi:hypothetical protein